MQNKFLYCIAFLFSLFVTTIISQGLAEISSNGFVVALPYGVLIFVFVFLIPSFDALSFKWDALKERQFSKKVRRSGLSEGEYIMTTLPEEDVSFFNSHADDLPKQENYAKYLAHTGTITFSQSDALIKYIRFLHSDRSEGAYVFSLLSDFDENQLTHWKGFPGIQGSYIQDLVDSKTITPTQAEALMEYCKKMR